MSCVRVAHLEQGARPRSRVFIAGRRVHHGLIGLVAIGFGLLAVVHDWADRWWFPDREGMS